MGPIETIRGSRSFFGRAIKMAFTGKFWLAEKLSGGATILLAILATYIRGIEATLNWIPLQIFAYAFLSSVMVGFLHGCYLQYREQFERADGAEAVIRSMKSRRWVNFALAAKEAMSEDFNRTMQSLLRRRKDGRITYDEHDKLRDMSSFRVVHMRDQLWGAKSVAKGKCLDGSIRTIPCDFWKGARMSFREAWAENGKIRYTDIEIGVPLDAESGA